MFTFTRRPPRLDHAAAARPVRGRRRRRAAWAAAALLALGAGAFGVARTGSGVLWHLVHDECVVHARAGEAPAPCAEVSLPGGSEAAGHAVLKDLRGPLQFLLIPTRRSPGIDDPALLRPDAPPYFAQAWKARRLMAARRGAPVPRDDVALVINSSWARSQDQLHIHISCVRRDLRARLLAAQSAIGPSWALLDGGWMGHPWWVRRVAGADLDATDPFRDAAAHVPGAAGDMAHETLAVVGARFADGRDGFFLLASHTDLAAGWLGSGERDVQDHDCAVLR